MTETTRTPEAQAALKRELLAKVRRGLDLTQQDFAYLLGYDGKRAQSHISDLECGKKEIADGILRRALMLKRMGSCPHCAPFLRGE